MADETQADGGSTASVCPWCSTSYEGDAANCPGCGATLTGDAAADPSLPGLTAIDAAAIVRAKQPVTKSRNRLLSWISGDYADEVPSPAEAGALAPPDLDVRREMLRLELEAEVANLQAEADAIMAEAVVEGRAPDASPEVAAAAAQVVEEAQAVSAELDRVDVALDAAPETGDADAVREAAVDAEAGAPELEGDAAAAAGEATEEPKPA
jgi:hypothetical protein